MLDDSGIASAQIRMTDSSYQILNPPWLLELPELGILFSKVSLSSGNYAASNPPTLG